MSDKQVLFNPGRPHEGERLEEYIFDASEINRVTCYKNGNFDTVYGNCNNDYVRYVLDKMPVLDGFKYRLVDVKLHVLQANECTCMPGYHLDGSIKTTTEDRDQGEQYTLFVAGPQESATEFLDSPFPYVVDKGWNFKQVSEYVSEAIPETLPGYKIPPFTLCSYDYRYFHRGPIVTRPTVRMLIRQVFSNNIRPRNEIIQCRAFKA